MPVCSRCHRNIGPFSFRSYSKQSGRCNKCDGETQQAVLRFIDTFCELTEDGVLTPNEWERLKGMALEDNLDLNEALSYARPHVLELIRNTVAAAIQDEVLTSEEERQIRYLLQILAIPDSFAADVRQIVNEWKVVESIRKGNLPVGATKLYMLPDEICHLETEGIFVNTQTKTYPRRQGTLTLTNKKLIFISAQTAFDLEWKKVKGIVKESGMIYVEGTGRKGTGFYETSTPMITAALMSKLLDNFIESEKRKGEEAKKERTSKDTRTSSAAAPRKKSAYEILDVAEAASRDEIIFAYRRMAKLYHPDKVATLAAEFRDLAEVRMKEINIAYQELTK